MIRLDRNHERFCNLQEEYIDIFFPHNDLNRGCVILLSSEKIVYNQ